MPKIYNALTGLELKKTILREVERELDHAGINSAAITFPAASWSWSLTIRQMDADGVPMGDKAERTVKAGDEESVASKVVNAMRGGSKRFRHNPPSPTEVRVSEEFDLPEG
jgi:hypothetical protein